MGAVPLNGEAMRIINVNKYGKAVYFKEKQELIDILQKLVKDRYQLKEFRNNLLKDRDSWAMEERIKEVNIHLEKLLKGKSEQWKERFV